MNTFSSDYQGNYEQSYSPCALVLSEIIFLESSVIEIISRLGDFQCSRSLHLRVSYLILLLQSIIQSRVRMNKLDTGAKNIERVSSACRALSVSLKAHVRLSRIT